ncbi:hypothetical protein DID88_002521 [Monilinia fructigena]|uniref:non-specific serine/threonine protein kinase n=1 Tax=Monilinia fructigena TaxID=38457 RepID=A0A395IRL1_9HELO|nr:hypothetical protein DID88_002521 [Monilinia fructigena]
MSTTRQRQGNSKNSFQIHNDEIKQEETTEEEGNEIEESRAEDDDAVQDQEYSEDSDEVMTLLILPLQKILPSTFSTVYKAEDLLYEHYDNDWDLEEKEQSPWTSPPVKKRKTGGVRDVMNEYNQQRRGKKYVAIKKIYVTSSPTRILNELDLLNDLRGCDSVCPLITAFRHTDQVVAVLPYFRHTDFREYFRKMKVSDMQVYFRSLFTALKAVHAQGILHRDIKPTNFLYEPEKQRGVLVDFGLAEREEEDTKSCLCTKDHDVRKRKLENSVAIQNLPSAGYPNMTTDHRVVQIGLELVDFGHLRCYSSVKSKLRKSTYGLLENEAGPDGVEQPLTKEEKLAVEFLERCLELNPHKRISAEDALNHPFLLEQTEDEDIKNEDYEDELSMIPA